MLRTIVRKIQPIWIKGKQQSRNKLVRGAVGSLGLKIAGSGLALISSVIFARFLGAVGLGTYAYAIAWVNILSLFATLGIDRLIVREIAVYRAQSRWELIGGFLRWSNFVVLGASLSLTIIAGAIAWNIPNDSNELVTAIVLSMTILPIASLRNLRLGAMKGLNRVVLGQMPDFLFTPIITLALTSVVYFILPARFGVFWVLGSKIIAIAITFLIGTVWLWRSLPQDVHRVKPQYLGRQWLAAALPFMFLGTVELLNTRIDLIMLGAISGAKEVGVYTVILGISQLTIFIHQAANSVLGPTIATLYSQNKLGQLEQLIRKSVLAVCSISLIIGGACIGLGKYLLLVFGSEYVVGWTAMNILILGQIFNALTGPVGIVLNMTGKQNYTAIATVISAALNTVLNLLLIPQQGIVGAAIATTVSTIAINVIKVALMQKTLNISLYSGNHKINVPK